MLEREIREMAFTPRWGIVRTIRQQYLAEHTFFVAMYANDLGVYLGLPLEQQATLLQMALWHDMDEVFTGDWPGPAKRALIKDRADSDAAVSAWMAQIFDNVPTRDGENSPHNKAVRDQLATVVKLADMIDECCEMGTEWQLGNQNAGPLHRESLKRVEVAITAVAVAYNMDPGGLTLLRARVTDACEASCNRTSDHTKVFGTL